MSLLDIDVDDLAAVPGREAWCAGCGHWYGTHLFGGCEELIPCAGRAYACTCSGRAMVDDAVRARGDA